MGCNIGKTAFGVKSVTVGGYDSPVYKNQSSARAKAKAELEVAALDFMEGVTCRDIPQAHCGAMLKVENAGWPFNGSFVITKVLS